MTQPTNVVRCKVTGTMPIRDAISRESVPPGGTVRLIARTPGERPAPCARHPRGSVEPVDGQPCTCGTTLIDTLVRSGAIELVTDDAPKAKKD